MVLDPGPVVNEQLSNPLEQPMLDQTPVLNEQPQPVVDVQVPLQGPAPVAQEPAPVVQDPIAAMIAQQQG
jgi:hypothetical protein